MKYFALILLTVLTCNLYAEESTTPTDQALQAAFSLQNAFTSIADRSIPAIVVIRNKRNRPNATVMYPNIPEKLRPFFNLPSTQKVQHQNNTMTAGYGSGFFIDEEGHILTNFHVIKDADSLEVQLSDGSSYETINKQVKIIGIDTDSDLAVLKIEDSSRKFPFLKFANSEKAKVGEWAIAIGAPFNLDYSMTVGIVSQKGRNNIGKAKFQDYIQTDASINPGNSGGPLLNLKGEVLGINNCILTGGGKGSIGIGFAIAANFAKQTAQSLIEHGVVNRAFLGIIVDDLTQNQKESLSITHGILVRQVQPGSPGSLGKLLAGDIILSINQEKIETSKDFFSAMAKVTIGDIVNVEILRNGQKQILPIKTMAPRPISTIRQITVLGLTLNEEKNGLKIVQINPKSPFVNSEIALGHRIIAVNDDLIESLEHFQALLLGAKGKPIILLIEKENKERYLMQIKVL